MDTKNGETRPDPQCYLPKTVINFHLEPFRLWGASSIIPTYYASLVDFRKIGYVTGQWVLPYNVSTDLLKKCSLTSKPENCVLHGLSIPISKWDMFHYSRNTKYKINRVMQLDVYPHFMDALNLRIPSGNEDGTNDDWIPGGFTKS